MNPISGFELAAGVAQFATFTLSLISQATEIYQSSGGLSKDVLTIETIYNRLQMISSGLDVPPSTTVVDRQCQQQVQIISDLSKAYKTDCTKLLGIVASLKVDDGPKRKWKSFRAALKVNWENKEITKLEERLGRTQTTLTLQICEISNIYHESHRNTLRKIQEESDRLKVDQSHKLDEIREILMKMQQRIPTGKKNYVSPFSPDDISEMENQFSSLIIAEQDITKQQSILQSLTFYHRTTRHSDITNAQKTTFEWVLKEGGVCEGIFLHWLKNDNGVFWVSGKPGSGKSTLMKFIADHPQTKRFLYSWSCPKQTYVASHYFWSAGSAIQKSHEGLLQTLLYDIFRQCPNLLTVACPQRWSRKDSAGLSQPWSLSELRVVLDSIAEQPLMSEKFCFFIDGLDEYNGDHLDICQDLKRLAESLNIKLCISSRDWNVFEDSFGKDSSRKVCIHKLTNDDIRNYAELRLLQHPEWERLKREDSRTNSLIEEVTERAQGVFLWVFLVTNLLRDGLSHEDSFSDLHRRLGSFPSDLGLFFRHILDKVDPFYHEKMSGVLAIAVKATSPLHAMVYHFYNQEYESMDYALQIPVEAQDPQEEDYQCKKTKRRLNGWCKGLLEVKRRQVGFLHRTVKDFLATEEMAKYLQSKHRQGFNANLSILRAYTAWVKIIKCEKRILRIGPGNYNDVPMTSRIREAMRYASELEDESSDNQDTIQAETMLLDAMEAAICVIDLRERERAFPILEGFNSNGAKVFFREHVIKMNLSKYLLQKIGHLDYFNEFEITPLAMAIHSELWADKEMLPWTDKCISMIEVLLANGEDPNDQYEVFQGGEFSQFTGSRVTHMSAWAMLYSWIIPSLVGDLGPKFIPTLECGLLTRFLRHKADPNALVWRLGQEFGTSKKRPRIPQPGEISFLFRFKCIWDRIHRAIFRF